MYNVYKLIEIILAGYVNNQATYKSWISAITILNNQNVSEHPKNVFICSKHFKDDCFKSCRGSFGNTRLNSNAVPSIFPYSKDM